MRKSNYTQEFKDSTILTSNIIFSQWLQVFGGNKIVTTAILDRVITHM